MAAAERLIMTVLFISGLRLGSFKQASDRFLDIFLSCLLFLSFLCINYRLLLLDCCMHVVALFGHYFTAVTRFHSAAALGYSTSSALICVQELNYLFFYFLKALPISDIVYGYAPVRATKVCLRQREKAFLSGCVPDLELDNTALYFHVSAPLIDCYSAVLVLIEYIICEPKQQ